MRFTNIMLLRLLDQAIGQNARDEVGYEDAFGLLLDAQLIRDDGKLTERGVAYLQALCNLPLPQQRWVV